MLIDILSTFKSFYIINLEDIYLEGEIQNGALDQLLDSDVQILRRNERIIQFKLLFKLSFSSFQTYSYRNTMDIKFIFSNNLKIIQGDS